MSELGRSLAQTGGALERDEHVSTVLRLRRAAAVAVVVWPGFALVDWYIVTFVQPGRLWFYLTLRAIGLLPVSVAVLMLYSKHMPSPRATRILESTACASLSALISAASIEYGGIVSPLVLGVMLVLLGRGAIIADRWQRAVLPIGLIAAMHPFTLGVLALFDSRIATQFGNSTALAGFALNEVFVLSAAALTLVGGHMIWSLRRQVFEARSLGRYRLKHRIGAGGMGEVWAAHHHSLKRDVAVKILKPETRDDPAAVARFEREVRATTELVHPHTVRVFDYGVTEDGLWYYAMELLDGLDLHAMVSRQGPLDPMRAARLIWQGSKALAEAHSRGIVHRDIKPENLFVITVGGEGEFIKVLDFGLAKLAVRTDISMTLTGEGWAVGTPKWASPEVVTGGVADPRSDVYGLGAVLYFLLCGGAPFEYSEVGKMLMAHVHEKPLPPSRRRQSAIPAAIEGVVMRCLEKDPARRYPDAAALTVALEQAVALERAQAVAAAMGKGGAAGVPHYAVGSDAWDTAITRHMQPVSAQPADPALDTEAKTKPRQKTPTPAILRRG